MNLKENVWRWIVLLYIAKLLYYIILWCLDFDYIFYSIRDINDNYFNWGRSHIKLSAEGEAEGFPIDYGWWRYQNFNFHPLE